MVKYIGHIVLMAQYEHIFHKYDGIPYLTQIDICVYNSAIKLTGYTAYLFWGQLAYFFK